MYKSFIEDCLNGDALLDEIDEYVQRWHDDEDIDCDLEDYIGLTEYESEKWLQEGNDILRGVLYCRRYNIDYEDYEAMSDDKRIAARSYNIEDIEQFKNNEK